MDRSPALVNSHQLERRATGALTSTDLFPPPPHRLAPPTCQHPSSIPQLLELPPLPSSKGHSLIVEYGIAIGARDSQGESLVFPLAANSRLKESRRRALTINTSPFVLQPAPRPTRPPPSRPPPSQPPRRQASLDSSEALDHSVISVTDTSAFMGSKAASQTTAATSVTSNTGAVDIAMIGSQGQLDRARFGRQQHPEGSSGTPYGKEEDERWEGRTTRRRTSRRSTNEEDSARIHLRADSAAKTLRQMMSDPSDTPTHTLLPGAPLPAPSSSSSFVPILPLFAEPKSRWTTTPQDSSSTLQHYQLNSSLRTQLGSVEPTSTPRSGWDAEEKEGRRARRGRKKAEKAEMQARRRRDEDSARVQASPLYQVQGSASVELPEIETLLGGEENRFSLGTVLHELEAAQERVAKGDPTQPRPAPPWGGDNATRPAHLAIASDVANRARSLFASREKIHVQQPRARGFRRWFGRRATSTPSQPALSTDAPPSPNGSNRYQSSPSSTRRPANRLRKPKPPPTQVCESGRSRSRRAPSPPSSLPSHPPQLSLNLVKHDVENEELTPPFEEVLRIRPRSQSLPSRSLPSIIIAESSPKRDQVPPVPSLHPSPPPAPTLFDRPVDRRLRSRRAARRGNGEVRAALISSWLEGVAGSEGDGGGCGEEEGSTISFSPRATVLGLFAEQEQEQAEAAARSSTLAMLFDDMSPIEEQHPTLLLHSPPPDTPSSQRPAPPNLLNVPTPQVHFAESSESLDLPRTPSLHPRSYNSTPNPSSPRAAMEDFMPSTPPKATSTLNRQTSLRGRISPFPLSPITINSRSSNPIQTFTAPRPPPPPPLSDQPAPSARRVAERSVTFADEPTYEPSKTQSSSSSGFTSSSSADAHLFVDRSLIPRRPLRPPSEVLFPSSVPYSRSHRAYPRPQNIPERAQVHFVPPTLVRRTPSLVRTSALNARRETPPRSWSRNGLLAAEEEVAHATHDGTQRASVMSELSEVSEGPKLLAPGEAKSLRSGLLRALPQEGSREGFHVV